jgi:hypothetical protein
MSEPLEQLLSEMLRKAAPAAPRVGWEQRAAEAMAQTAPRSHTGRRVAWWKLAPVGIVIAMLLPAAIWWLPRRGGFALARVVRATAHVRSAHYVGWELGGSGAREPKEAWIEPKRVRMTEGEVIDDYLDESRFVEIRTEDGQTRVTIDPLPDDVAKLLGESGGYLQWLLWRQAAQEALDRRGETLADWERQRLPDGRRVVVADFTAGDRITRLTVDERTDLIMWVQSYRAGGLIGEIGPIEYNVDIPEEIFHYSIPEGAIVVDNTTEAASLLAKGITPPDEELILTSPRTRRGSCGSPFHTRLRFWPVGEGVTGISYVPSRNSYRVVGKVRITGDGLDVTVENREYVLPFPPDVTVEEYQAEEARRNAEALRHMPPPEVERWREAERKELAAAGAQSLGMCDGWLAVGGYHFDMLNDRMIEVWYLRSTNAFYVMGKAHLTGHGTDQVVEDGWVKVSGPPLSPEEFR